MVYQLPALIERQKNLLKVIGLDTIISSYNSLRFFNSN